MKNETSRFHDQTEKDFTPSEATANRRTYPWSKALFFALLVGFLYFLPHALFIFDSWPHYHYPFLGSGDERHYCASIREAGEENFHVSNPFFVEHKNEREFIPSYAMGFAALLAKLFFLPLEQVAVLLDFLAPFGIFLILFSILFTLTRSPWLSIVGASAVL